MDTLILLSILVVLLYGLASGLQARNVFASSPYSQWIISFLGAVAILLHGVLLHHWIDMPQGQNLSPTTLFSMMIWLSALLTLLSTLRMPVMNLILFIYPCAMLSIIAILLVPYVNIVRTGNDPHALIHIFLSIITTSMLCIAAVQATFLAIQEKA